MNMKPWKTVMPWLSLPDSAGLFRRILKGKNSTDKEFLTVQN